MRCLGLSKVVDDFLVRVGLLDIIIIEVDNRVAIGEYFPLHSIVEDYLLLPVLIDSLDLPVMPDDLLHDLHVLGVLVVVDLRELHVEVFLFLLSCWGDWWLRVLWRLLRDMARVVVLGSLHLMAGVFMI